MQHLVQRRRDACPTSLVSQRSESKAVYVGCGTDVRPIRQLCDVKEFLYIDSQPRSEFGALLYDGCARTDYPSKLESAMKSVGMFPSLMHNGFEDAQQRRCVKCLLSTAIPEDVERVDARCDVLIVAGHDPHSAIVSYACNSENLHFVGFEGTVYDEPDDPESVCARLDTDASFRAKFAKFTFFASDARREDFYSWSDFLDYASKTRKKNAQI